MKSFLVICLFLFTACGEINTDNVKSFITGTYVTQVKNQYNRGRDTLVITVLNDNIYKVKRISSFSKIRNRKLAPLERKFETWTCVYNSKEKVLHEMQKGKMISFRPNEKKLLVGSIEYRKIKN